MFKVISRRNLVRLAHCSNKLCKRFFLSEAFKCEEAWENRLKSPVLQKLNFGGLYSEMEKCFGARKSISVIDIDLFANGITTNSYQNELEDILFKLRADPETSIMLESTQHAVIRWYLSSNIKLDLLNVLSQRMLFGIFPDVYLSLLMMDTFLKEDDCVSPVKIAALQMLQDDCDHPILRTLSLYSCIRYLNSSEVWETPKNEVDEDEEVVKVRIKFARNEYFDDHFDIVNTNHIVGKTMTQFGKTIKEPLGISSQLVGLVLHEKYDGAKTLSETILQKNLPVLKDAVEKAKSYLENKPKQAVVEGGEEKSPPENSEEPTAKAELKEILNKLSSKDLLGGSLEEEAEKLLKKEIEEHEKSYIEKQIEIYKKWEVERLENIEKEIANQHKKSVMEKIRKEKEEIEQEEMKLFYFDNEFQNVLTINKKRAESKNVKYYRLRRKKYAVAYETDVPPLTGQNL